MKGLILKNAYYDAPVYAHQCARIKEELEKLGIAADVRANDFFPASLDGDVHVKTGYDFCVFLDKDNYVGEMLERAGMRLFNSAAAVAACDDKMLTAIRLSGIGVPMPRTLPGLLCYTPSAEIKPRAAAKVAELGFPVVVKTAHGSMGKGVFRADDEEQLLALMEKVKCSPHLFQEYIAESAGRDLRVIVVGGRVLGGMERVSDGDFRSNIGAGGSGRPYPVGADAAALCVKIADALGLDFCGIDLLFGRRGMLLCEVNSNAFFKEFESVTGVNVAAAYARHIADTMAKEAAPD